MIIQVNDNYRIQSDVKSWTAQKKRRHKGETTWEPIGYFAEFENALVELSKRRIRLIDSSIPDEIRAAISEIKRDARRALDLFKEAV